MIHPLFKGILNRHFPELCMHDRIQWEWVEVDPAGPEDEAYMTRRCICQDCLQDITNAAGEDDEID